MTQAFPLQWPEGWPRTPVSEQTRGNFRQGNIDYSAGRYSKSLVTFATARDKLFDELRRLGSVTPVVSTDHPADRYGIPTESKRKIGDEGVAVYFTLNGRAMAMACDRFDTAAANLRSLGLAIEAMRQLERHGGGTMVERAFSGFVALPAPSAVKEDPWTVLGVKRGASVAEIETAYREKAKVLHPDRKSGDTDQMARLNAARVEALANRERVRG